jgi:hypothetical protein
VNATGKTASLLPFAGTGSMVQASAPGFKSMFLADLDNVFFNAGEFAELVQYYHLSGPAQQYSGIFDDPTTYSTPGEIPAIVAKPQVQLNQQKMVAAVRKGDRLTVRGTSWSVLDFSQDGVGVLTLYLERS